MSGGEGAWEHFVTVSQKHIDNFFPITWAYLEESTWRGSYESAINFHVPGALLLSIEYMNELMVQISQQRTYIDGVTDEVKGPQKAGNSPKI